MRYLAATALVGSALAFGVTTASAADLPVFKAPPAAAPFSWTGFYVGGNVGALSGNAAFDPVCPVFSAATCPVLFPFFAFNNNLPLIGPIITFVPASFASLPGGTARDVSVMGGVQAGYNYQVNQFVLGVEGDVDATHIRASLTQNAVSVAGGPPGFFGAVTANSTFSSDWIASIRARAGIAWERTLLYATGGVAFTEASVNTTVAYTPPANAIPAFIQPGPTGASSSQSLVGWTLGAGAEWAITNKWSVGAEYRHYDFGSHSYVLGTDVNLPAAQFATTVKYTADQATVRLNWHWDAK